MFAILGSMYNSIKEFFLDENINFQFQQFGILHLTLIFSVILIMYSIYKKRDNLYNLDIKQKAKIKNLIFLIMISNMAILDFVKIISNTYNFMYDLPIHLCYISGYLFMFAIFTCNKNLLKIAYFLAFIDPLPAIIWTNVRSVDSYTFIYFLITHHFYICANFLIYYMYYPKINKKDIIKTILVVLFLIIIPVYTFNHIFNTNYIMSKQFPDFLIKLYPFLKNVNQPFPLLFITALIVLMIAYIPVKYRNIEMEKISNENKRRNKKI